jgi:sarcosine oxidase, subunit gamma
MRAEPLFQGFDRAVPVSDDLYQIVVRRSFADYFCRIMLDAAAPLMS